MQNPLVSIVIPVFRAHDHIRECAVSLFEQDFPYIEYVFIDDCSDDDSIDILHAVLKSYPDREDSVIIDRMPSNSGVSAVRQYGISLTRGKYIIHCDSDDWIEKNMISSMYYKAETECSDMVVCDFYECIDGRSMHRKGKSTPDSDMASDALLLYACLWNKLVRASIVKNSRIIPSIADCGEDMTLVFQYALLSEKVSYINIPLYHYVRNCNSILGDRSDDAILNRQKSIYNNYHIIEEVITKYVLVKKYNKEMVHLGLYIKNLLLPLLRKGNQYRMLWIETCKTVNKYILVTPIISVREKICALFVFCGLYPFYGRFLK